MDNSLSFLLGLAGGVAIGLGLAYLIDKKKDDAEDPDGKIKQQIMDKLNAIITDIKSTI